MNIPEYSYYGLVVSTWDLWRGDTSNWPDRTFYLEMIRRYGQPAVDIGCGTGRLVLDYLQEGIDIDGVDNSPEMLVICHEKAEKLGLSPNLYQQDMLTLELPRKYRTIIGSSSVFQHLPTLDLARQTLKRFFDHLEPGGIFVAPFGWEWRKGEGTDSGWRTIFEKVRPEDGATVRSLMRSWCEPEKQWWNMEQRLEVELDGEMIQKEEHQHLPDIRWYTQAEVKNLYQELGFTNIQLFKSFELTEATADERGFCAVGVKPD